MMRKVLLIGLVSTLAACGSGGAGARARASHSAYDRAMAVAWRLYEKMGFERSPDLDFDQNGLPVFGSRLRLETE